MPNKGFYEEWRAGSVNREVHTGGRVWITYLMPGTGHIFWFCWIEFPGPAVESDLLLSYH